MDPLLTDDNTADEDLDKPNSLLISVCYTRQIVFGCLWNFVSMKNLKILAS